MFFGKSKLLLSLILLSSAVYAADSSNDGSPIANGNALSAQGGGTSLAAPRGAESSSFIVQRIKVRGLKGISLGTVLSYLPVQNGDRISISETSAIIRSLYKTGFFSNVALSRRGNTLIVTVVERPIIGEFTISGNKKIKTKALMAALKSLGFSVGRALNKSTLVGIKQSLIQQYYDYGHYNVVVETKITKEVRNRVAVSIIISEGPEAKIKKLNIVGNKAFSGHQLLKQFSLTTSGLFTFFTNSDQYSKSKLNADLERLRSFYMDNGYLRFNIDDTKVKMSKDKKQIFITIYVTEGKQYRIKGFTLGGRLLGKRAEITKLITLKSGQVFSRKQIMDINSHINTLLGDLGYAYPNIAVAPKLDDKTGTVFVQFNINPGRRIYVRRINFSGNFKTSEKVLRREMRQQEGSLFSYSKLKESKRHLANLGYLRNVDTKITRVPNHPNQVDVNYSVKEVSSAQGSLQVGYSDIDGFVYGAGISDSNFMGSGKSVGVQFQNSAYQQLYSISYTNPYYTINGVSFGLDTYYQKTTPDSVSLSSYTSDAYGLSFTYGFPMSDRSRVSVGYGFEHMNLHVDPKTPTQIIGFLNKYGNSFDTLKVTGGWTYSSLDRAIFPTSGFANMFGVDLGAPVFNNSIRYYKFNYTAAYYYPFPKNFGLHLRMNLGYGNGYGRYDTLPFFKNFYCGGIDSVRGFSGNSLGPLDSNKVAIGGNVLGSASFGVIFPNPMGDALRTTAFVDAGNVYQDKFSFRDLRSSVGIGAEWRSPMGILTFAVAKPIAKHSGDDTEVFQFTIGTSL